MNAEKAREIVKHGGVFNGVYYGGDLYKAQGYLAALEGEEMAAKDAAYASLRSASEAVVDAVEKYNRMVPPGFGIQCAEKELRAFRKAVGEKGR